MIIGINGKIGSGKDTVGKIIQYLTSEYKDKYDFLEWRDRVENYGSNTYSPFEIKKFAGKLKTIASLLTGIPVEKFEDQEFKKQEMPECWNKLYWNDPDPIEGNDYLITQRIQYEDGTSLIIYGDGSEAEVFDSEIVSKPMTYREFLQKLGTEAMRDGLHTNVWVNALFADYNAGYTISPLDVDNQAPDNWIITDMRFPNEMEAVEKRKGITIRVVRYPKTVEQSRGPENIETVPFDPTNNKHMDLWKGDLSRLHASETALDDAEFDYEIINDAGIPELIEKVRKILINEKII